MPLSQEVIGLTAAIIGIGGYVPYIISIFKGATQPNRATWIIWTVIGGLLAFSYMAEGNPESIWLPFAYFLGPFFVALLSFKYGYTTWTKLDTVCIVAGLASLIPWALSHDATFTLIINLIIDGSGALPTIVKTYQEPETEDAFSWVIFAVANTLQLFAISTWNITSLYPIYLFVLAGSIAILTCTDKWRKYWRARANRTAG